MPLSETLIEVTQLSRDYGRLRAVHDISFNVQRGEVLGFLGPNGAGKTTTMQVLAGILAPSAGRVKVAGADILLDPRGAKRAMGYLPETPPLYRDFTVDEYLDFCSRLHEVPRSSRRERRESSKKRCGLHDVGSRVIGNLSKGYQQRIGIAQAILHAPEVVILDEPTVGLDPIQIREIRGLIRELRADHSVLLSTHILPEVQAICDRVIIIANGRLVLDEYLSTLNQNHKVSSMRIRLSRPPLPAGLEQLTGVGRVEDLGERSYRLHFAAGDSPAQALVERSVSEGWGLQEMVLETRTLEEIFVQLALGDVVNTIPANGIAA